MPGIATAHPWHAESRSARVWRWRGSVPQLIFDQSRGQIHPMNCETKTKLLVACQEAADAYSRAVAALNKGIGVAFTEYERLRVLAERARLAVDQARTSLDAHVIEHGC